MRDETSTGDTDRDEVRLRIINTDETGVADIGVYDCGLTNPMKEDYAVSGGAEIIVTVEGGEFEIVEGTHQERNNAQWVFESILEEIREGASIARSGGWLAVPEEDGSIQIYRHYSTESADTTNTEEERDV